MNTLKTVGDLKRALSVYADDATFEFSLDNQTYPNSLNNDTQVFLYSDTNVLHVSLFSKENYYG